MRNFRKIFIRNFEVEFVDIFLRNWKVLLRNYETRRTLCHIQYETCSEERVKRNFCRHITTKVLRDLWEYFEEIVRRYPVDFEEIIMRNYQVAKLQQLNFIFWYKFSFKIFFEFFQNGFNVYICLNFLKFF